MADYEDMESAPPAGEEIHIPAPSLLPVLNAAGLAASIVGLTISIIMVICGLLLFFVTAIAWIWDARREYDELPASHHH